MKSCKINTIFGVCLLIIIVISIAACSRTSAKKLKFNYYPPKGDGIAVIIGDKIKITEEELMGEIKNDVYEKDNQAFKIKYDRMKILILNKLMSDDPRKKNLSNDQYLEKYIHKNIKISKKEIDGFIKDRKIPKQHINDMMKERIVKYLVNGKKRESVETWLASQLAKHKVHVFINKPTPPIYKVEIGNAPLYGKMNAVVKIIEFSDFECPFCGAAANTAKRIKEKFGNKVVVAFKHLPLPFHTNAKLASIASMCAHEVSSDKFWKLHDVMFADQSKLDRKSLINKAKKIGLNVNKFTECIDGDKYDEFIKKDMQQGKTLGIKATPTFFINGRILSGARPMKEFEELVNEELNK